MWPRNFKGLGAASTLMKNVSMFLQSPQWLFSHPSSLLMNTHVYNVVPRIKIIVYDQFSRRVSSNLNIEALGVWFLTWVRALFEYSKFRDVSPCPIFPYNNRSFARPKRVACTFNYWVLWEKKRKTKNSLILNHLIAKESHPKSQNSRN